MVHPYVDGVAETSDTLSADIVSIDSARYTEGSPNEIEIEITDPPSGSAFVTLPGSPSSMDEGNSATFTFTRSGGDTAQPLTVRIRVDDPEDFLRGNHWDQPPYIPQQVIFAANSTSETVTLTAPDDHRNLDDGDLTVTVLASGD